VSCGAPRIKAAKNIRSSDCRRRERNSAFCDAVHRSIDPSSLMQRLVSANRPSALAEFMTRSGCCPNHVFRIASGTAGE